MTASVPLVPLPRFRVGNICLWRGHKAIIHDVPHEGFMEGRSDYELIVPDLDNDMVVCAPDQLERYNRV